MVYPIHIIWFLRFRVWFTRNRCWGEKKHTHTHNNRTQTKLGNLSVSRIPAWRVRAQRNRHNYRYYRVVGWKRGEFMCYGITGVDASMLSTFSARARAHNVNELIIKCARARVFCVCLFVCVSNRRRSCAVALRARLSQTARVCVCVLCPSAFHRRAQHTRVIITRRHMLRHAVHYR